MNVTVFGATGAIGRLTVDELLTAGDSVTAYVRNTQKVPAGWHGRVRVVEGEMSNAPQIDEAVAGADAVVSALGPTMDRKASGLPLIAGTSHILDSLRRHGVTRYVGHATPSLLDPRERPTLQTRLIGFLGGRLFPRAHAELKGMNQAIMASDLDWTIIRFTAPNDAPKKGALRVGFYGSTRIGSAITRADIAAFTAAQVRDTTYVRAAPAVSN